MKIKEKLIISFTILFFYLVFVTNAQCIDSTWTLQKCINHAIKENIQIRKTQLTSEINKEKLEQSKFNRFPSLEASVNQNFSWEKDIVFNTSSSKQEYGNIENSNSSSYGLNSSVVLYNGNKISNNIKQSKLNYEMSKLDIQTTEESISLNVLSAFLQVLYSQEQVNNSKSQVDLIFQQLQLAEERLKIGLISKTDYLQIKSQWASEKLSLTKAENQLAINKVNLMQLLEIPVNNNFEIAQPLFYEGKYQLKSINSDSIYNIALNSKPQIKNVQLNKEKAQLNVKIAKADYYPRLTLNSGIQTGYSSLNSTFDYNTQIQNRITPTVGFNLSIPIFQNKQTKTNVKIAKINIKYTELDEINTKNQLRKSIEQTTVDIISATKEYESSIEQYNAANESFLVASEKFKQKLINSIDFLSQKTNFINAESKLLQAKYNLIFSYKTLDYYLGIPLTL